MYHRQQVNLKSGTRLGPYEIVSPIGAGGMGEVYRARDTRLGRAVAVKVLSRELAGDARLKSRFDREARTISALNHPHICALYDVGDSYLVMEYCEGETLARRIARGPVPLDETLQYGLQIADALDKAHRQRIVHRDLKPSNIMLTGDGVKLLDFGLARQDLEPSDESTTVEMLTEKGLIVGTVQYMAPEVLLGKRADSRSDLFALGLILYEMATGKRPFDGSSKPAVIGAILEREPAPLSELNPDAPPALDRLVRACLKKNPEERIPSADDVRLELRALSEGRPGSLRVLPGGLPAARARRSWSRPAAVFAAAALIAIAVVVGWGWWRRHAAAAPRIESVVVLPFESVSKTADDYLVEGMHDGVIGELSQLAELRVISRTSAMHYKDANKTVPEIARELDVDGIVEGSVRRSGQDLHVQVSLLRARPQERQVWSRAYDRAMGGATALQTDIARGIALASKVVLTGDERARLARARGPTTEGYEAYLKGMYYVRMQTPDGARKGLEYLQEAVSRDPSDPSAHAGLALAYAILGHSPSPPPQVEDRARAEAEKAIELDGTLAEGHAALGAIAMFLDWDWPTAGRELRRALQLNPNSAETHRDYAWFLELGGPNPASIEEMKRATELDPLTTLYRADLADLYYRAGRIDDAMREARATVELDPNDPLARFAVALTCSEGGRYEEAIAAGRRAASLSPVFGFALAYAYAKAGRRDEAEIAAQQAARSPAPITTWGLAYTYAALGDKDEALRWIERGVKARFGFLLWMKGTPGFAILQGDPRFEAIVKRLNLPA
jgi:TolB-like protein/tetratricopeptide (TPR) repeat protein